MMGSWSAGARAAIARQVSQAYLTRGLADHFKGQQHGWTCLIGGRVDHPAGRTE